MIVTDNSDQKDFSDYLLDYKKTVKPKSLWRIMVENSRYIGLMLVATVLLTIANLGKGAPTKQSILGFERCSWQSFTWFFVCMALMLWTAYFGYLGMKRRQYEEDENQDPEESIVQQGRQIV